MFKTHSRTDQVKAALLFVIGLNIILIVMNLVAAMYYGSLAQKEVPSTVSPQEVQQQTIQKAYELMREQTLSD